MKKSPIQRTVHVSLLWLGTVLLSPAAPAASALQADRMFGDHMVLQRDMAAPLWGKAPPGETIVVSFRDQKKETTADAQGNWRVKLEPLKVGEPGVLTVRGGGFEWFGHAPAHLVLTAYGLMEFSDMARVYDIDPAVIERTREWLYAQQKGDGSWQADGGGLHEMGGRYARTLQTTAYVTWAMAESDPDDQRLARACDFLAQGATQESDPYTLALCANALLTAGRPEAKAILQRLSDMQIADDKQVHWTSAAEGATFSRGEALEIETTALAAYALLKAGSHTDAAHKALAWLVEHKDPYGTWHSTQATVHAMRALLLGTGAGGHTVPRRGWPRGGLPRT